MDPHKINVYTCEKCKYTTNEQTPWKGEGTTLEITHTKDLCENCYQSSQSACSHEASSYTRLRLRSHY